MSISTPSRPGPLRHWHPVLLATDLGKAPIGVKVHGKPMVLFRARDGVAALDDRCVHRGARLSTGCVEDGCVVCPYHLWRFDGDGRGESPVNPRMRPFTTAYDAAEHSGLVWVRARGGSSPLPEIDGDGMHFIGYYTGVIQAPFPIVVDNFTEIEHSPTNHFVFAFDAEGIKAVEPRVEMLADGLRVVYTGPQRPVPWWTFSWLLGIRSGLRNIIDFRVRFAPIHWVYDFAWENIRTGQRRPQRIREFAFITPFDEKTTGVFIKFFTSVDLFASSNPARGLFRRVFLSRVGGEFRLDKDICENVAGMDPRTSLEGFQLGKFDHVLRSARNLITHVYEGAELQASARLE